ncbi:MAG: hypothetical protein R2849_10665 [Thermomicrobiales bacterium]
MPLDDEGKRLFGVAALLSSPAEQDLRRIATVRASPSSRKRSRLS